MEKKLQTIWEMAMSNPNGGTINPHTLQPITKGGWVIAVADTQNCFGRQGLKTAYDYAIKYNMNLGWWMDKGKMYWDASIMEADTEKALRLKEIHRQLAIYNLETGEIK